jgi:hypothetical protein
MTAILGEANHLIYCAIIQNPARHGDVQHEEQLSHDFHSKPSKQEVFFNSESYYSVNPPVITG